MSLSLAVHGGAGTLRDLDPQAQAAARAGLARALAAGAQVLTADGAALAAVEAAVRVLEDEPSFNAGRGSALTALGTIEMDAALIDGASARMGAVAGVSGLRHPIHAARLVMSKTRHVLLVGPAASAFALAHGAEPAAFDELVSERARRDLARALAHASGLPPEVSRGTVGAVARDRHGRLAAGTSTGGLSGKLPGRVGDAPLPGAGTWADGSCAVSATGDGEYFMRTVFAHRLALAIADGVAAPVAAAAGLGRVQALGGSGGCIVMSSAGPPALVQLVDMYRGSWSESAGALVAVLGGDALTPA